MITRYTDARFNGETRQRAHHFSRIRADPITDWNAGTRVVAVAKQTGTTPADVVQWPREGKLISRTETDAPALTANEFCTVGRISRRTSYTQAERNESQTSVWVGHHQQGRHKTFMAWLRSRGRV